MDLGTPLTLKGTCSVYTEERKDSEGVRALFGINREGPRAESVNHLVSWKSGLKQNRLKGSNWQ